MHPLLVSAVAVFVATGVLALIAPSTWPLLLLRVVLIAVGIALLVVGLRRRRMAL